MTNHFHSWTDFSLQDQEDVLILLASGTRHWTSSLVVALVDKIIIVFGFAFFPFSMKEKLKIVSVLGHQQAHDTFIILLFYRRYRSPEIENRINQKVLKEKIFIFFVIIYFKEFIQLEKYVQIAHRKLR